VFSGLFPRSSRYIAIERDVLSKSSTLTRDMTPASCTEGRLDACLAVQPIVVGRVKKYAFDLE
jgi:hypothetical protein